MTWLGLALMVSYIPGWVGITIPTSWVLLSVVLPLALWRPVEFTGFHWVVLSWAILAIASCAWAFNPWDAAWGTWQVLLFAMAFWFGSGLDDARPLWRGIGWGLNIAAILAVAQAFGWHPTFEFNHVYPSAFYYNSMLYGEICAIGILGLIIHRHWRLVPLPLLGLALSHSHGGWLALLVGIVVWRHRSLGVLGLLALGAAAVFTYHFRPSDTERLQAWYSAVTNLAWFGHGPGSFLSVFWYRDPTHITYPEYAHNDYLQLAFEYGLLAIIPLAAILGPAFVRRAPDWPIYAAFLLMGTYSFPLYSYILAPLGAICAGRVARSWGLRRRYCPDSRFRELSRLYHSQQQTHRNRGFAIPLVP